VSWFERFNQETREVAEQELLACCASPAFARKVADRRPFADHGALLEAAETVWWHLPATEWLAAFAAHPRIGESKAAQPQPGAGDHWSAAEQRGVATASDETRDALAQANQAYEDRFGYTYIVCATGRTAQEMLQLALLRLRNESLDELRVAAGEQAKITRLRLLRLLGESDLNECA
jgi:2-oxo-4-hydroxy-4-carboxy-5-ureidoimidazoline decarboxylase